MTPVEDSAVDAPVPEPVSKKAKIDAVVNDEAKTAVENAASVIEEEAGWPNHTLNINHAIVKAHEGKLFSELAESDCDVLEGLGAKSKVLMEECRVKTVKELAQFKWYQSAKSIAALAPTEEAGARAKTSKLNVDQAVNLEYETKSLNEMLESPLSCMEGLSEAAVAVLAELKVHTVADLANFKFCKWAEAIVALSALEHSKSKKVRTAEGMLKKIA